MATAHHVSQDSLLATVGPHEGLDSRATLIRFYQAYISSKIDYGCEVYGSASPTLLKHLEVVQNTAFKIALGIFKSSPFMALQAEAGLP